ncbi:hypothetical protein LTR70_002128 [Exophiala xenobiotica]|nr:hypothetical protein LTR70_002128 [Exophiala xenobiotica]
MPGRRNVYKMHVRGLYILQAQVGIHFLGSAHPWPPEYKRIFRCVDEIGQQMLRSSSPDTIEHPDTSRLKERAERLARHARVNSYGTVNEATLRAWVEPIVFERPVNEMIWWANPSSSHYIADLFYRLDMHSTRIFADICQAFVEPDPRDVYDHQLIPKLEPDRVFGINRIGAVEEYTKALPLVRHSPFRSAPHILYPFLVIEAKSGPGAAECSDVDQQTAFPLRTCLMLQEKLRLKHPLVWYMQYKGNEWRLAACVLQDDEMHAHQLWKGSTHDSHGAFQLLRLIDHLCEWARNSYIPQITECLEALHTGKSMGHASTGTSGDVCELVSTTHDSSTLSLCRMAVETPKRLNCIEIAMNDVDLGVEPDVIRWDLQPDSTYFQSQAQYAPAGPLTPSGAHDLVARHANHVVFESEHFAVPESLLLVSECLTRMGESVQRKGSDAADWLRALFGGDTSTTMTKQQLTQAQEAWRPNGWFAAGSSTDAVGDDETLMRVCLQFETYLDPSTWHTVRKLCWLTCSYEAAKVLLEVADKTRSGLKAWVNSIRNTDWPLAGSHAIDNLYFLHNQYSFHAAARPHRQILKFDGKSQFGSWCLIDEESLLRGSRRVRLRTVVESCVLHLPEVAKQKYESSPTVVRIHQEEISMLHANLVLHISPPHLDGIEDCVMLRRGEGWPDTTPTWCLYFLKGGPQDDSFLSGNTAISARDLQRCFVSAMRQGQVYEVGKSYVRNIAVEMQSYSSVCQSFFEDWARCWAQTAATTEDSGCPLSAS